MADRYWVGGTANWDGTAGTKWATTSGGPGGASVPTSADDVFFSAASTGTCTISSGNTGAKSINCTGFTGTLAGSAAITVSGSVTLVAGMTFTYDGVITFNATATITSAGKTFLGTININGSGITVTLGDAYVSTSNNPIFVTQGTLNTANYNITCHSINTNNSNIRTITLGSSTITLNGASNGFDALSNTNLTFNAGTSTFVFNATNQLLRAASTGGSGLTFHNVSFTSTTSNSPSISGINTFNNLTVTAPSAAGVTQVTFDSRQTINGTLSTTGTAGNRRVWFRGATYGLAQTLTINSAPSLTDADFRDLYVIGTAAPISGARIGNLRGCRGITFDTPKTVYWNLAGAQNWSATGWSDTSTGTPSNDFFPLPQDTATFTDSGSVTGTITMNSAVPYTGTVDMSGRTSAMTLSIGTGFTIYGDWKNGSGTTLSGSSTITFSGRNIQNITSAGKTFSCPITVDSYGGTVQLVDALNIGSNTFTVTNGTFDTKNYNVTAGSLSSSNSNVRTITLGSSTLTLSATSNPIGFGTSTNLTFNAGTSQINCSAGGPSFSGGGMTFYNVTFTGTSANTNAIAGANTFTNLTVTASASAGLMQCTFGSNQTITGTLTVAGASPVRRIFVRSDTLGTTRTLTVGTLSATDCDFRDITIAGGAAGSSPTRAGDCGGNSGITFPSPKTVYWNLAGAQNWSATAWASGTGGSPDINNFPLAQDTAVFDEAAGSVTGTITINAAWNIGTFDASARTSAMTLTTSTNAPFVYGDWKFGTGVTSSSTTGTITFAKRGTQTITSNGITFGCPVTIDCITGTVQLADALSLGSTRTLNYTSGTFDAVTYNVTAGLFDASGTAFVKTLKLGSGTWTISGTGFCWSVPSPLYMVMNKGTANIVFSDTSTNTRRFTGGGQDYNKVTIGGTTGTSTFVFIDSGNTISELASTKTVAHTIDFGSTNQRFGKWTVTGTAGNVVTLSGTSTGNVIAGAATSGIDYLAMGSVGFSSESPGEFYAGANSTGTAGAPVYRTATPAGGTRYWVGGTGNWSDTNRWSTGSGGLGGASVPTSLDDVVFNSASNATAYTATVDANSRCKSLTISGPASGNITFAGSSTLMCHGNVTFPATGITRTFTGTIILSSNSSGLTFTTNGTTLSSYLQIIGVDCSWSLGSALNIGNNFISGRKGTFSTANYNITAAGVSTDPDGVNFTYTFGSSTITVSNATPLFGSKNTTINAGTSTIVCTAATTIGWSTAITLNNVTLSNTDNVVVNFFENGATINNLTINAQSFDGVATLALRSNITVNGTLTISASANPTRRRFIRSDTIGTTRTMTVAAFAAATDVDFRDITIAGAAAPVSGTRFGDCKGNSGITFPAGKTVYVRATGSSSWSSSTAWSATSGGAADATQFPLAQDTIIFPAATYPASGSTMSIDGAYNIGTIDMSLRTSNTVTLATGSLTVPIYGNWINGTGTTISGTNGLFFAGRGSQTLTSAGKSFSQLLNISTPGGSVTLQDAFTTTISSSSAISMNAGTFDANGFNVTLSGASAGMTVNTSLSTTFAVGAGTITIAGSSSSWNVASPSFFSVTGTGTIKMTSGSAKTFAGGGLAYTNITLDQGGAGTLTISGNNTFKDITNTYKATGATAINFGTTTQRVSQFTAAGESGRILTIQGTSASSPGTLVLTGGTKPNVDYLTITGLRAYSFEDTWYAGANSTNNGSLGWIFAAAPVVGATGNFFLVFG